MTARAAIGDVSQLAGPHRHLTALTFTSDRALRSSGRLLLDPLGPAPVLELLGPVAVDLRRQLGGKSEVNASGIRDNVID
jgi:hypothetical protein